MLGMKIASEEIRNLVVKSSLSGTASKKQLSQIFGYTIATINNWLRGYQREERLAPLPRGHRKAAFTQEELQELASLVNNSPDITLAEQRSRNTSTKSVPWLLFIKPL